MPSRCDLHVHSKHSDRPAEWYLDRIGAPESYTEPVEIARLAKARGMSFVTIADHDTINGALEIAHLPESFVSCEVTAAFPEDGTQVHVLALGLSVEDFAEIDRARRDLYALVALLRERGIVHALAHPLLRVDDRLTLSQLERCLLLFECFELVNGTRDPRAGELFAAVVESLTPELLDRFADRHGIAPNGDRPWRKRFLGGSDDHCGLYLGTTWTETPEAATPAQFLAHLAAGDHRPGGEAGSSLKLARAFQALAHDYYRRKVLAGSRWRNDPIADLLRRLAAGEIDPQRPEGSRWLEPLRRVAAFLPALGSTRPAAALLARAGRPSESSLMREEERAVFEGSARLGQRALARALDGALSALVSGRPLAALSALSTLATGMVSLSPYAAAFALQHKDEGFHREVASAFGQSRLARKSRRRAWATDTLFDVNGVARTVATGARHACRRGHRVTVVTSLPAAPRVDFDLECFAPIWERPIPGYPELALRLPPIAELVEMLERERFGEVIVSTPGPVGLAALAGAKLLGLPTVGVHHTDFPRYVAAMGGGEKLAEFTRRYLAWFYSCLDRVLVSSTGCRRDLLELGVEPKKIEFLPRGVDADLFHPCRREDRFYVWPGVGAGFTFLYVGRLAPEKNLEMLLAAFERVAAEIPEVRLAIVGDGPSRARLEQLASTRVTFCGVLRDRRLAAAYASADAFAFPSCTDTFGNAVLEAMASGLPVIVTRDGGPAEQVADGVTGSVVPGRELAFAAAMRELAGHPELAAALGSEARRVASLRTWNAFVEALFGSAEEVDRVRDEAPSEELAVEALSA